MSMLTLMFLSSLTMQPFSLFLIPLSRPSLSLFWVLSPGNHCWLVRTRIVLGFTVVMIWELDFVALLVKFLRSLKIDIHAMQLLLMKRGGEVIYAGLLGLRSKYLVDYFQVQYFTIIYTDLLSLYLQQWTTQHNILEDQCIHFAVEFVVLD